MKRKIAELRKQRAKLVDESRSLLQLAETEKRQLTEEESTSWDALQEQIDGLAERIAKLEKQISNDDSIGEGGDDGEGGEGEEGRSRAPITESRAAFARGARGTEARKSFESVGEFLHSVRFNPGDQRLEHRDMKMSQGSSGGFMVPKQFADEILKVSADDALVRPRARVIPAGDPPDAGIDLPVLNQGESANVYGGVEVKWIKEGGGKPKTDATLRQVELQPEEVAGYMTITDKLLRNWSASGTFIEGLLREAIIGAEEIAFLFGSGVGKPFGVLNPKNPALIKVPRKALGKITYLDILKLEEAFKGQNGVYVASRKAHTEISQLQDAAGRHIWKESATQGAPAMLNGLPYFRRDELPGLGETGDLALVDLSYYLIKDGSGPFVAQSEHVHFLENATVIKAFWNVDAQPWLDGPLKTVAGDLVSPFTCLKKEIA